MNPYLAMLAGQSLLGGGQTTVPAPQPQPVQSGLLGVPKASDTLAERLAALNKPQTNVVQDAMAQSMPAPTMDPRAAAPAAENASPAAGIGNFFGNLDSNFSRPSMQLGLGILGRVHPLAPYAGLLAGGLFGDKKVF